MTPDLDALDALAAAARETWGDIDGPEWQGPDWLDAGDLWPDSYEYEVAAYIAALDPATVRSLIALARLGAAWEAAEAALPEGHTLDLVLESHVDHNQYLAWTMRHSDTAIIRGTGPTPLAALTALAAALRTPEPVKP